ncbi:MAG: tRNA (adenosine(37)-N6)-threonylcarbamoyltransferase complex dimerization subunit type 1 TsaB, partial [Pseudomonadota bacterium]
MSDALVLGFDTSGPACAAALLSGGTVVAHRHEAMAKGQAERLLPMLEEVLAEANVAWSDLAALGVGVGPGNFTGVRIAVSAARGVSLGLGLPTVGVSALEAQAFATSGVVISSLDARRDQLYLQVFEGSVAGDPLLCDLQTLP